MIPLKILWLGKLKVRPTGKTYIEYYLDLSMRGEQDET